MRFPVRAALAVLAFCAVPAALAEEGEGEQRRGVPEGSVVSLVVENDYFVRSDDNYTNGLRLEVVSAADRVHPWLRELAKFHPLIDLESTDLREGFTLSHAIYTPDDISLAVPPEDSHPYAGYLGLSGFASARSLKTERTLTVEIGLVGPAAGGEFVQANWHRLIDGEEPAGWDTQLGNELVFAVSGQRLQRFEGPRILGLQTDLISHAGATLGTLRTSASAGATLRIGTDLSSDFAPPRIRPALAPSSLFVPSSGIGGYIFAGFGGYLVGKDVFLDGNTFSDSRSVDKRHLTGDFQAGGVLRVASYRLSLTYVVRSEQFVGQQASDSFGAISLSYAF
ncbi:lipid A deacylase LpxR family protein [Marinicauda pacifica]|uniref:lipid A deacylase LpxR family protein n=1 Tax=Marinicauda pacifica TaxID=1133559 RepID=UPI0035C7EDB5